MLAYYYFLFYPEGDGEDKLVSAFLILNLNETHRLIMDKRTIAHIGHSFQQRQTSRAYKPLKRDVYLY
jgi:hypothetical protein